MKWMINIAIIITAVLLIGCDEDGSSGVTNPTGADTHRGSGLILNTQVEHSENGQTSVYELCGNAWYSVDQSGSNGDSPEVRTVSIDTEVMLQNIGEYGSCNRIRLNGHAEEKIYGDNGIVVLTVSHDLESAGINATLYIRFQFGPDGMKFERAWIV